MKILLDHNLDRRLKKHLRGHEVATAFESGWADVQNGELLTLAEDNGFNILLTADANIKKQQNLTGRTISIVVLRAYNNRLSTHLQMLDKIMNAFELVDSGSITEVIHQDIGD